jgi:hypothetical protein
MDHLSRQDRINTVFGGGGHIVILGAGASLASTLRNPDPSGRKLPLMGNFVEVVGLEDIVEKLPNGLKHNNFEQLFSTLYQINPSSDEVKAIEERVFHYFKSLKLPDTPTIYDYLVLSLRPRDIIATLNWDPYLYQAWNRNHGKADLPYTAYLHGNVAIGYDQFEKRWGPAGMYSKPTGNYLAPTRLLYPVAQKNYNDDEFIVSQWDMFKDFLADENVRRVTVFGYSAPTTDVEAMDILYNAWTSNKLREVEDFEVIDVRDKTETLQPWRKFLARDYFDFTTDFFKSSIARNPRRTSESYFQHSFPVTEDEAFSDSNPVPSNFKTLDEMWTWYKPLIDAEEKWKKANR